MVLTRDAIRREIAAGRLVIEPFARRPDRARPRSTCISATRSASWHGGGDDGGGDRRRRLPDDHQRAAARCAVRRSAPGETIHGITRERMRLPPRHRRVARGPQPLRAPRAHDPRDVGLRAPGVDSRQVLEMSNVANAPARDPRRRAPAARSSSSAARAAPSTRAASRARIGCERTARGSGSCSGSRSSTPTKRRGGAADGRAGGAAQPVRYRARRRHRDALRHRPRGRDRAAPRVPRTASRRTT